jgi:hypothetical protein
MDNEILFGHKKIKLFKNKVIAFLRLNGPLNQTGITV